MTPAPQPCPHCRRTGVLPSGDYCDCALGHDLARVELRRHAWLRTALDELERDGYIESALDREGVKRYRVPPREEE